MPKGGETARAVQAAVGLRRARGHRLATVSGRRRKHWGWGFEDQQPSTAQVRAALPALAAQLSMELREIEEPVPLERV
jgi:hypothetical protein